MEGGSCYVTWPWYLKRWIRTVSNFDDLIQFQLICQMLAKFERTVSSLEKEKGNFCVVLTYFVKRVREIGTFHVAVVQRRLRNVQKSVMHVHSCCFAYIKRLLFFQFPLPSPALLLKLLIVVIQTFCYHGNVTSHFSSLFRKNVRAFFPQGQNKLSVVMRCPY